MFMKVCELWKTYLQQQKIWQKCVENFAKRWEGIFISLLPDSYCGYQTSAVFHPSGMVEAATQTGR